MRKWTLASLWLLAVGATVMAGCGEDAVDELDRKGVVDEAALRDGVSVTLEGALGRVAVPLEVAIPETDDEGSKGLLAAVSLVLRNPASGTTADLSTSTVVDGEPTRPGEWAFEIDDAGEAAEIVFFNESPLGDALVVGRIYDAQLSIAENELVEEVAALSFAVAVVGQ